MKGSVKFKCTHSKRSSVMNPLTSPVFKRSKVKSCIDYSKRNETSDVLIGFWMKYFFLFWMYEESTLELQLQKWHAVEGDVLLEDEQEMHMDVLWTNVQKRNSECLVIVAEEERCELDCTFSSASFLSDALSLMTLWSQSSHSRAHFGGGWLDSAKNKVSKLCREPPLPIILT